MTTLVAEANRKVEAGTHEMAILDKSGEQIITWSPDDDKSLAEAKAVFDQKVRGEGFQAFNVMEGNESEVVRTFDPQAEHVVLSAPLVGG